MILFFVTLIASILVFFTRIDAYPLRNWDEAWYGQIIKNMASGNYHFLMPFFNGRYYFDHSPLYFWLSVPIVKVFGAGEWQIRLVSAISSVFATLLVFLIGKKMRGEKLGLISALVFLTFGQVVIRFSHGNLDALLVCLFLASFYFYLKSETSTSSTRFLVFTILCGITIGLGILVKSWGIGLFPIALIFVYSIIKNRSLPKNLHIILASAFISFAWWYAWGILTFGRTFISWYVLNPSESRLATPIQNFSLFYFKILLRDIAFWFIPPLLVLILSFKKIKLIINPVLAAFLIICVIYISSLNFLNEKSDWYNIPAYPQIAIIIGYFSLKVVEKFPKIGLILIAAIAILQAINTNRVENIYPDRSKVGTNLGVHAKELIPPSSTVILDDHDFTSFLFYSDQNAVYTIEDNKKNNFQEWWKINHKDLQNFIQTHQNVWIITPNPNNLNLDSNSFEQEGYFNNYYFLKHAGVRI